MTVYPVLNVDVIACDVFRISDSFEANTCGFPLQKAISAEFWFFSCFLCFQAVSPNQLLDKPSIEIAELLSLFKNLGRFNPKDALYLFM